MKSGFKDRAAIKEGKKINSPWNFDCPPYDERTSCFVNAGTNYGVGHRQPVGHKGDPKQRVDVLPYGRQKPMETDYVHKGRPGLVEINEDE